ncbi:hypothetical protein [Deinococcus pimensis]|uniref:hypothetical protein n=1 Tax=Deinococcus pimensis TaxID=309888 RepID=UPI000480772C|nr:hypothetical protein [Deinococcus pimensis]
MAYTVMLWLVNPGPQVYEAAADALTHGEARSRMPGAMSGVTEPPAATRLVYGVFDTPTDAELALAEVEAQLAGNRPVRVAQRSGHVFLVPAHRVHYAVVAEVVRPKDVQDETGEREQTY